MESEHYKRNYSRRKSAEFDPANQRRGPWAFDRRQGQKRRAGIVRIGQRAYRPHMKVDRAYHCDPEILGGVMVFKGTRVPVKSLFDHLKAGDSIEVFVEGFPSVSRAQVLAVLEEFETDVLSHV